MKKIIKITKVLYFKNITIFFALTFGFHSSLKNYQLEYDLQLPFFY